MGVFYGFYNFSFCELIRWYEVRRDSYQYIWILPYTNHWIPHTAFSSQIKLNKKDFKQTIVRIRWHESLTAQKIDVQTRILFLLNFLVQLQGAKYTAKNRGQRHLPGQHCRRQLGCASLISDRLGSVGRSSRWTDQRRPITNATHTLWRLMLFHLCM